MLRSPNMHVRCFTFDAQTSATSVSLGSLRQIHVSRSCCGEIGHAGVTQRRQTHSPLAAPRLQVILALSSSAVSHSDASTHAQHEPAGVFQ